VAISGQAIRRWTGVALPRTLVAARASAIPAWYRRSARWPSSAVSTSEERGTVILESTSSRVRPFGGVYPPNDPPRTCRIERV